MITATSIPGFAGHYASEDGRIWRLTEQDGESFFVEVPVRVQTRVAFKRRVTLECASVSLKVGAVWFRGRSVARLVCMTYHGTPGFGCYAAHKDGDPLNNHRDNLEWRWWSKAKRLKGNPVAARQDQHDYDAEDRLRAARNLPDDWTWDQDEQETRILATVRPNGDIQFGGLFAECEPAACTCSTADMLADGWKCTCGAKAE